jgi:hypothetical protein
MCRVTSCTEYSFDHVETGVTAGVEGDVVDEMGVSGRGGRKEEGGPEPTESAGHMSISSHRDRLT